MLGKQCDELLTQTLTTTADYLVLPLLRKEQKLVKTIHLNGQQTI